MNMQKILAVAVLVVTLPAFSGCATYDSLSAAEKKRLQGQVIGGVTGAALGSLVGGGTGRSIAIGAGAVVGSIIGGEVSKGN